MNVILILLLFTSSSFLIINRFVSNRTALDVYDDLSDSCSNLNGKQELPSYTISNTSSLGSEESIRLEKDRTDAIAPCLGSIILTVCVYLMGYALTPFMIVAAAVFGFAGGLLLQSQKKKKLETKRRREIEYFLPVIMERIVMAVQAGLDIVAAIHTVRNLSNRIQPNHSTSHKTDPVTELLNASLQLTEAGVTFDHALSEISRRTDSTALKHAFIHLSLAYREGGQIVMPLMELSSSTQVYYQETVEEEIARMPAKVTMPLVCIFAGLILLFITIPLIQVLDITNKSMPM